MIEGIASFLSSLKQVPPVPLLTISVASGIFLFAPAVLSTTLGISEFRESQRGWIGGAFVLSTCYLLAHFFWWGQTTTAKHWNRWQAKRSRQRHLHQLTAEEKGYLLPFSQGVNSQNFAIEDGIAGGLDRKGIIYRATNACNPMYGFPYNLQPWGGDYLEQHPELLEGAKELPQPKQDEW